MAKQLLSPAALMFLGGILLLAVLSGYSSAKGTEGNQGMSSMQVKQRMNQEMGAEAKAAEQGNASPMMGAGAQPAAPAGQNGGAAAVQGMQTNMRALPL